MPYQQCDHATKFVSTSTKPRPGPNSLRHDSIKVTSVQSTIVNTNWKQAATATQIALFRRLKVQILLSFVNVSSTDLVMTRNSGKVFDMLVAFLSKINTNWKRWQLTLHCHLKPPHPPVVLGLITITRPALRTHKAQSQQISARSSNARLHELLIIRQIFTDCFSRGGAFVAPSSQSWTDRTKPNWGWHKPIIWDYSECLKFPTGLRCSLLETRVNKTWLGLKIETKLFALPPAKISVGMGKMSDLFDTSLSFRAAVSPRFNHFQFWALSGMLDWPEVDFNHSEVTGTIVHQLVSFNKIAQCEAELIGNSTNFSGPF